MSLAEQYGKFCNWHEVYVNGHFDHHEPGEGSPVYEYRGCITFPVMPECGTRYEFKIEELPETSKIKPRLMECQKKAFEMYGEGYRELPFNKQFHVRQALGFVKPGLRRRGE